MTKTTIYFSSNFDFITTFDTILSLKKIIHRKTLSISDKDLTDLRLIIIDGAFFPQKKILGFLDKYHRIGIPFIILHTKCTGQKVMELIKKGAATIIFKNYSKKKVEKEIIDVLMNYRYLTNVKESTGNEKILTSFLQTINTINSNDDIDQSIHKILHAIKDLFHFNNISFYIYNGNEFIRKINYDAEKIPDFKGIQSIINQKKVLALLEHSPTFIITHQLKEFQHLHLNNNSMLLPIKSGKKLLGAIYATYQEENIAFSENKKKILSIFINYTSVILENAKLYWDIIKTQEKLIQEEKKSLMNQMIISLNHEINNPLSIISMQTQLLQKKSEPRSKNLESRLDKIELNIDRIKTILEKISDLNTESDSFTKEYLNGKRMINITNDN
jgi:hypothetical protein